MTTYTWEYGSLDAGLQFTITYDDTTEAFTVTGLSGSFDLNALWFSDDDADSDGYVLLKSQNNLNMNGENVVWEDGISSEEKIVWDTYVPLSSPGSVSDNKLSFITAGESQTFTLADLGLTAFDPDTYSTLGVRATSVNGTGEIKWADEGPEIDEGPGGGTIGRIVYSTPGPADLDLVAFTFAVPASPGGVLYQVTNTPGDESLSDFTEFPGSLPSLGPVILAPLLTGTFQNVNVGPGDQTDPSIELQIAAYTSTDAGVSQVRYYDFFTNEDQLVPTTGEAFLSDVAGGRIVYTQPTLAGSEVGEIGVFNTAELSTLIIPGGTQRSDPSIGSALVAFEDNGLGVPSEIVVYDLVTATTTRLTNDSLPDVNPEVSADGSVIVFQKTGLTDSDIWVSVQTAPGVFTTSALTAGPGEDIDPTTNGSVVAWASDVDGDFDIYYTPVGGGVVHQLDLPGIQRNPSISGDLIAFESNEVSAQFDIYLYDIGGAFII
jgi:hypothetical protein